MAVASTMLTVPRVSGRLRRARAHIFKVARAASEANRKAQAGAGGPTGDGVPHITEKPIRHTQRPERGPRHRKTPGIEAP